MSLLFWNWKFGDVRWDKRSRGSGFLLLCLGEIRLCLFTLLGFGDFVVMSAVSGGNFDAVEIPGFGQPESGFFRERKIR